MCFIVKHEVKEGRKVRSKGLTDFSQEPIAKWSIAETLCSVKKIGV